MRRLVSTRTAYGEALLELAREGLDVVGIAADTSKSMCVSALNEEFPERCYDVGIAEQNMMTIAAGMAAMGKMVFASTYAAFSSMKTCEQVRTFIAYPNLNVKIVSGLGGFSAAIEGVTHLALEDIGIMRCIPNLVIINPADAVATKKAVRAAADHVGPVYIRLGRDPSPVIFDDNYSFTIGKGVVLIQEGSDVTLMTSGLVTVEVLEAARSLNRSGIGTTVIELPTIKPLDEQLVVSAAEKSRFIVTVEEHNVIGGLGSAVAEVLSEKHPVLVRRIGVPDCFAESGTPYELRDKYGMTAHKIVAQVMDFLKDMCLTKSG